MALEVYTYTAYIQPIFGFLLSCLFILHIYWFILMQGILVVYFKRGVAEDSVNKNRGESGNAANILKQNQEIKTKKE